MAQIFPRALLSLPYGRSVPLFHLSSELLSGLLDIHRSFISFMTDAGDQVIRALRGLFKGLQTRPSESSSPLLSPLSLLLLLFSLSLEHSLASAHTYVYTRSNSVARNFIPAIGVAYSPCECR